MTPVEPKLPFWQHAYRFLFDPYRLFFELTLPQKALVIANIVPLFAIFAGNWNIGVLIIMYWTETVIIGFYNVLKMLTVLTSKSTDDSMPIHIQGSKKPVSAPGSKAGLIALNLFLTGFFILHFGGFCAVHGTFVFAIFGKEALPIIKASSAFYFGVLFLFISHGISFLTYYRDRPEGRLVVDQLFKAPYGRIIVLHMFIIFGGMLFMLLPLPQTGLLPFVLVKVALDLHYHVRLHDKTAGAKTA